MQNSGNGAADGNNGDPPGGRHMVLCGEKPLRKLCQKHQTHNDQQANTHKQQIVLKLAPKIIHGTHLE